MTNIISNYIWPGEVHLGFGAVGLVGEKVKGMGATAVFIIADPGIVQAGLLTPILAGLDAAGVTHTLFDGVVPNPTMASVHEAGAALHESGAGIIVGVGGGSALDTAKAVKLWAGGPAEASIWEYAGVHGDEKRPYPPDMLPYIAIPTTAGTGAEVTPWAVITNEDKEMKFGVGDAHTIPDVAVIDPDLTLTLPPHLTAATGMDTLSHLIEAYVSTNHNPVLDPLILHGVALVGRSLRPATARGDRQARLDMMEAAMIGGIGISSKWLGACHSLAHPLSALADVHHGLACAIMLPPQMAYSLIGAMERYADIAVALEPAYAALPSTREQAQTAVTAVRDLMQDIGLPLTLSAAGVSSNLIPALSQAAYADLNWWTNPRQVSEKVMADLYRQAF